MRYLSLKKQMFLRATILAVVSIAVALFLVIPKVHSIVAIKTTIIEQQTNAEQQHEQSKQLRRSLTELTRSIESAKALSEATLTSDKELAIIKQMEALSEKNAITQQLTVSVKEIDSNSPLTSQGISSYYDLAFLNQATFEQHIAFLQELEQLPFYVIINELHWSAQKNNPPLVTLQFRARIYIHNP